MIKALVSLDADLASSIALRYACQMANTVPMDIKTIHVEEADAEGNPPGTGWVRRTWEKGLLGTAEAELSQLLNAERPTCPTLGTPKMKVGDRDQEILSELEAETYDLLVEGVLYSFKTVNFEKKIRSKLYQKVTCPILLVKNLVALRKAALLVEDHTDLWSLIPTFFKILEGSGLKFDLVHVKLHKPGRLSFNKETEDKEPSIENETDEAIAAAGEMLAQAGWIPEKTRVIRDIPTMIANSLQDFGLVVSCLPRHVSKKNLMLELLSRIPSAVLLCWQ